MMVSGGLSPFWAGSDSDTEERVFHCKYRSFVQSYPDLEVGYGEKNYIYMSTLLLHLVKCFQNGPATLQKSQFPGVLFQNFLSSNSYFWTVLKISPYIGICYTQLFEKGPRRNLKSHFEAFNM